MENTTQFRLDAEMAVWRSGLAGSGNLSHEDLQELESHMLDEIEQLTQYPLSEREAFMIAKDRIGNHSELSRSYARSKTFWSLFLSRSSLYLQAVLAIIILSLTSRIAEFGTILTVARFRLPISWGTYLYSGLLAIALASLFLWLRYMSHKARNRRFKVSLTGRLTIVTLCTALLTIPLGVAFTGAPIQLELMSVFSIRQYIWIAGFFAIFGVAVVYSVRDFRSLKIKESTH